MNSFQDGVSEQFKGLKSEEFNFKYGIYEILKAYDFIPLLFSPSNACHTLSTLFTRKNKKKNQKNCVFIDLSFKTTHTFSQNKQKQITMKLSQYTRHFFLVFFISILNDYLQRE